MVNLIVPRHSIVSASNGSGIAIKREQTVSDGLIKSCEHARDVNSAGKAGELYKCAEIPVAVVNKWKSEGFDIYEQKGLQGVQRIMDRLRAEDMSAFVTTNKRIY